MTPGEYHRNGEVFRVRISKNGRPYAERFCRATGQWEYRKGALKNLRDRDLVEAHV